MCCHSFRPLILNLYVAYEQFAAVMPNLHNAATHLARSGTDVTSNT